MAAAIDDEGRSPDPLPAETDEVAQARMRLRQKFGELALPGIDSHAIVQPRVDLADGFVHTFAYYNTYNGHEVEHLAVVHAALRERHDGLIFLAGDSSLDNKAWFEDQAPALNGYEEVLRPPTMKTDVCYWLNFEAVERGVEHLACLNTAIEATTLGDRDGRLLPPDRFLRGHITANDFLIVSVGGNDIALRPTLCTILNMLMLVRGNPLACLRYCACGCLPCAGCCGGSVGGLGCFGCLRSMLGCVCPPGLAYFADLFGNAIRNYVIRILGPTRPKKVIVCMIYFLDEQGSSWADAALEALDYDRNPARLQEAIRAVFRLATRRIHIRGTNVVAFPLFEVLDGKNSSDYVSRVEPSRSGGSKIAKALMDVVLA